jgi:hypothetical protein
LAYPKEGEGSWGFYLELLDNTVHFEINTAGVSIDIEMMPLAQWRALGFPAAPPPDPGAQEKPILEGGPVYVHRSDGRIETW